MLDCGKVVGKCDELCEKVCGKKHGVNVGKFVLDNFLRKTMMKYTYIKNFIHMVLIIKIDNFTDIMMRFARFPHSLLILLYN